MKVRRLAVLLLLFAACAPDRGSPTGGLGGYVNGVCDPTTRTDPQGVISSTGSFGLIGAPRGTGADEILLVWRVGGPAVDLPIEAERLDAPAVGTRVWWSAHWASDRTTPWGNVAYRLGLKPIGNPGCWRIRPASAAPQEGVVVIIDPEPAPMRP